MQKTHWRKCDKTDFLGAVDIDEMLKENEKSIFLTIEKVEIKEAKVRGQKGEFRIATFTDKKIKPMILNVGNGNIVKSFCGNSQYVEDWINVNVEVYIDHRVRLGKETTEGLRLKPTAPKLKEDLSPKHPSWNPALEAIKSGSAQMVDIKAKYNLTEANEALLNPPNENK